MSTQSVQHFTKPLQRRQQHIALLNHLLILRILDRRTRRLDDPVYLVDRTV